MVNENIITPVKYSEWAAPVVPILKPDGFIRLCGDYKLTINQASPLEQYPIPRVEDLFTTLSRGLSFSKLDMSHAYQQIVMDENSKQYLTINTHKGMFTYNRLPFGVASAPAIFQRTMEGLLRGLTHVAVYLDDILVTGVTDEEHLQTLDVVLNRLQDAGLCLKRNKCEFLQKEVRYLGHLVDAQGLHPLKDKVQAMTEAPCPTSVTELKAYLGLLNYYNKFLPNLSSVLAPLHRLLRKGTKWCWGNSQAKAFQQSKLLLQSADVLVHYSSEKDLILSCDGSSYGVGAVLSHRVDDNTKKPLGFTSRTLTPAEQRYSQLDKEALAIIFGVQKFHKYLYGRKFTICTDHKPLIFLFGEKKPIPQLSSSRVQRWALLISAYEYTMVYKSKDSHANADARSRLPLPDVEPDLEFEKFMKSNGIRHAKSAPFHPSSNGLAEHAVPTFKEGMKMVKGDTLETSYSYGSKWIPAVIMSASGPVSYTVAVGNGQILKRHVDQIRIRHVDELQDFTRLTVPSDKESLLPEIPSSTKMETAPEDVSSPITKERETGKEFQLPDKLDTPAAPQLRRSSREKRPPIRLQDYVK
ncbi:putative protein K02A2.6-like protein [Labeo rohita]|uniref:ribonuclease H n=1 Tax=Labeo rohita TaxID=84645 RepID=A0A498NQH7_LABRO|nr:putative protein K02A2.6-like protein [Labeo rohita]